MLPIQRQREAFVAAEQAWQETHPAPEEDKPVIENFNIEVLQSPSSTL